MSSASERVSEILSKQKTERQAKDDADALNKQQAEKYREKLMRDSEKRIALLEPLIRQTLSEINKKYLKDAGEIGKDIDLYTGGSSFFHNDDWDSTSWDVGFCAISLCWSQTFRGMVGKRKNKLLGKDRNIVLAIVADSDYSSLGVITSETSFLNLNPKPKMNQIVAHEHSEKFETQEELLEVIAKNFCKVFSL